MSKVSFRARAVDAAKPLPVYHAEDIPDLTDFSAINRAVPQMPTGMEKEEEAERHLQEVILSQQTNDKSKLAYIPIPVAAIPVPEYDSLYSRVCVKPSHYVRVPGLGLEEELPDYDLDSEDEEWLNAQTNERPLSPTHFEKMMDRLEKGSGNTVLSERDAQLLLKDDADLVLAVYDYWLAKRLRLGRALIPTVRHERRDGTSSTNPYMAFRKRTEKMQTRKNRKNDEMAYMQMLKLKRDLSRACSLSEFIKDRDTMKQEVAQIQMDIFKKRYLLEDWSGSIVSSLRPIATKSATSRQTSVVSDSHWDGRSILSKMDSMEDDVHHVGRHEVLVSAGVRRKKKRKYYYPSGTPEPELVLPSSPEKPVKDTTKEISTEEGYERDPDGMFTFKKKGHVKYHRPRNSLRQWPWYSADEDEEEDVEEERREGIPRHLRSKRYRFSRTTLSGTYVGVARRRVGRGGRVLWDHMIPTDSDDEHPRKRKRPRPLRLETGPLSDAGFPGHGDGLEGREEGRGEMDSSGLAANEKEAAQRYLHFLCRSPSPTSSFEFQHFPFIEHPDHIPGILGPYHHSPGSGTGVFGGFTSDSDYQDEAASSFSSLPTSQFALKPSSSDVECDADNLEPRSWNGPKAAATMAYVMGEKTANSLRRGASGFLEKVPPFLAGSSTYPPLSSLQTSATHSSTPTAMPAQKQQVVEPKDMSRASLSVTNSKTIILSNAGACRPPAPPPTPPPSTAGGNSSGSVKPTVPNKLPQSKGALAATKPPTTPASVAPPAATTIPVSKVSNPTVASSGTATVNGPASQSQALNISPTTPTPLTGSGTDRRPVDAWSMNQPATSILSLDLPAKNNSTRCGVYSATVDAALFITSQFLQQRIKKEAGAILSTSTAEAAIAHHHFPLARLTNAISPRDFLQQPPSTSAKAETLPLTSTSSSVRTSLPATSVAPAAARRGSTNGSNYSEIFRSVSRQLSESDTGLKQALAGTVINHNNLLETTNSLVQLGSSSEVT